MWRVYAQIVYAVRCVHSCVPRTPTWADGHVHMFACIAYDTRTGGELCLGRSAAAVRL